MLDTGSPRNLISSAQLASMRSDSRFAHDIGESYQVGRVIIEGVNSVAPVSTSEMVEINTYVTDTDGDEHMIPIHYLVCPGRIHHHSFPILPYRCHYHVVFISRTWKTLGVLYRSSIGQCILDPYIG